MGTPTSKNIFECGPTGSFQGNPTIDVAVRPGDPRQVELFDLDRRERLGTDQLLDVPVEPAAIQQISSHFAEGVSQLPEMKAYAKLAGDAEDEYMPSGPPMSPLTGIYFTCWAFYDLRCGKDGDTIGKCQIDANDIFLMNPDQLDALKKLSKSRMGIYEHVRASGGLVHLRELITGDEFPCLCTSGYQGRSGELWYVRRLPPLMPELAHHHVIFTTPYILPCGDRHSAMPVGPPLFVYPTIQRGPNCLCICENSASRSKP